METTNPRPEDKVDEDHVVNLEEVEKKTGSDDCDEILVNTPEDDKRKAKAPVYFRWSAVMNSVVLMIFLPYAMLWIARGGLWNMEAEMSENLPQLDVHAWTALAAVILSLHQGITGPVTSMSGDSRRNVRLAHRIGGWITSTLLAIVCVSGTVIALQYFNDFEEHSTYHAKASLGVATMGIIATGILVGAIIAVKRKKYSTHKDLMIGLMVYVFIGAGIIRWLGSLFYFELN